jgi:hypothetical protein
LHYLLQKARNINKNAGCATDQTYSSGIGPVAGTEFDNVDVWFKVVHIYEATATRRGERHFHNISRDQLVQVLPCLLKGGIAK